VFIYLMVRHIGNDIPFVKSLKMSFVRVLKIGIFLGVGALIGFPSMVGFLYTLVDGVRSPLQVSSVSELFNGTQGFIWIIYSLLTRMYSRDIRGHFLPKDKGARGIFEEYNFLEAPNIYITLFGIILFLSSLFFLKQERKKIFLLSGVSLVIILVPGFQLAIWGFAEYYFRELNYLFCTSMIVPAMIFMDKMKEDARKAGFIMLISTLILIVLLPVLRVIPKEQVFIDSRIFTIVMVFLMLYGFASTFLINRKLKVFVLFSVIVFLVECVVLSETTLIRHYVEIKTGNSQQGKLRDIPYSEDMPNCSFGNPEDKNPCFRGTFRGEDLNNTVIYDEDIKSCVDTIRKIESNKFYRISNYVRMYFNENKLIGYYSTTTYRSINSRHLVSYLLGFGYMDSIELSSNYRARWIRGFARRNWIGEILNNVHYSIVLEEAYKQHKQSIMHVYDSLMKVGKVVLLRHKLRLPFGYVYKFYVPASKFKGLNATAKDIVATMGVVIDDKRIPEVQGKLKLLDLPPDSELNKLNYDLRVIVPNIMELGREHITLDTFSDTYIRGRISLREWGMVYLSFPYGRFWRVFIDDKEDTLRIVNFGMGGVLVPPGEHTITLEYDPPYWKYGLPVSGGTILALAIFAIIDMRRKKRV